MLAVIGLLGSLFPLGNIWQETASPNLSRGKHKKRAGESIISKPLNYQCVPFALSLYLILLSTMSVDSAKKAITACHILAWQWGWGLEQPIMAPLFSKICTQGYWAPSSSVTEAHASMTARISETDMSGSVTSDQGWKHMTLLGGEGRMTQG